MKLSKNLTVMVILITGLTLVGCSDSDPVTPARVIDTAPPVVPTGLAAFASQANVRLTWDANTTDADFAGFRVYRGRQGQATLLTLVPVVAPAFVDRSPLAGCATYAVAAVDFQGNESAWLEVAYSCSDDDVEIGIE